MTNRLAEIVARKALLLSISLWESPQNIAHRLVCVSICFLLFLLWASPGMAQSFDDAIAAYQRQDYAKALSLFEALGNQGSAEAQHNAGLMYYRGLGTRSDFAKAMAWYRRSAGQGFAASQYDLGIMYDEGEGVPRDAQAAALWLRKSAEQGFVQAQVRLAQILFASQDFKQAFFWWQKAADAGDASAMFNIGSAYYAGRGVPKDEAKAMEYYRKAKDAGWPEAERILKQFGAAADCMKVGEVETAQGELAERTFRSAGGQPLRAFVLTVPAPVCLRDDEIENVNSVRTIELRASEPVLKQKMQRLVGKTVFVRGTASAGLTAWFYSPIVIDIREIESR